MTEQGTTTIAVVDFDDSAQTNQEYWQSLIDEKAAAEFLGLTTRTLQAFRQRGNGPSFIRISARCIRYRRVDLRGWADKHVRCSTSDPGRAA